MSVLISAARASLASATTASVGMLATALAAEGFSPNHLANSLVLAGLVAAYVFAVTLVVGLPTYFALWAAKVRSHRIYAVVGALWGSVLSTALLFQAEPVIWVLVMVALHGAAGGVAGSVFYRHHVARLPIGPAATGLASN